MNVRNDEFKNIKSQDLKLKIEQLRQELFTLRLNASTAHIKDYSQFQKLRKNIARALTFYYQKLSDKS
jgi:ribosomal protein L29